MTSFVSPYQSSDREDSQTTWFWPDEDFEDEIPKHHPGFAPSNSSSVGQQDPGSGQSLVVGSPILRSDDSLCRAATRSRKRQPRASGEEEPISRPRRPPPTIRTRSNHEELTFWMSSPPNDVSMTTPFSGRTIGPILEDTVLHVFRIPEIVVTPPTPRLMVRDVEEYPMRMEQEASEASQMFEAFEAFGIEVDNPHETFRREYAKYLWGDWLGEGEIFDDGEEEAFYAGDGEVFDADEGGIYNGAEWMSFDVAQRDIFNGDEEMFDAGVGEVFEDDEE